MDVPQKKISFGFTKLAKQSSSKKLEPKADIQYIDCLESNTIKVRGEVAEPEAELIIPVRSNKKIIGDIGSVSDEVCKVENSLPDDSSRNHPSTVTEDAGKKGDPEETIEAIAVKEILNESQKFKETEKPKVLTVQSLGDRQKLELEREPTLTDYESVPVTDFGFAMLRGMGWNPQKGIGKNERVVVPTTPVLRMKGLGLGADKRIIVTSSSTDEETELKKGSYVQVVAGSNKNVYGQVESFDEEVGRVIIRTALKGSALSVNEGMVKVVGKDEYKKFARVLNLAKYEECKKIEETGSRSHEEINGDESDHKKRRRDDSRSSGKR